MDVNSRGSCTSLEKDLWSTLIYVEASHDDFHCKPVWGIIRRRMTAEISSHGHGHPMINEPPRPHWPLNALVSTCSTAAVGGSDSTDSGRRRERLREEKRRELIGNQRKHHLVVVEE